MIDFVLLVALIAIVYASLVRFVQNKLVDKSEMEALQAESKLLDIEEKAARERKDQRKIDEILQKKLELFPKMNKILLSQFKPMIFILGIFFVVSFILGQLDPNPLDDVKIPLTKDGYGCTNYVQSDNFSACFKLPSSPIGHWQVTAVSLRNKEQVGSASAAFFLQNDSYDQWFEPKKGEIVEVSVDKKIYEENDIVFVTAKSPSATEMIAVFDSGTSFDVNLPFTIPLLNIKHLTSPTSWLILVSLLFNILVGMFTKKVTK